MGWNQYYQLGYTSSNKQGDSKHTLCKSSPKRIPYFDNINIKYVACSKVHSCALSQDNKLYLWGLNLGQMGNKKPLHVNLDISHDHNNGYIIESPLVIDLSHLQVEQVLALELVTFIRCSGNTLIVLTDFCMRTFKISTPKPKNPTRIDIFSHYTPKTISADVVDMKCSNKVGNHLFSNMLLAESDTCPSKRRTWSRGQNYRMSCQYHFLGSQILQETIVQILQLATMEIS